jgi:hypothetical protein
VIEGRFHVGTGLPLVQGRFWLFDIEARAAVDLVVDVTLPRTVLSTSDLEKLRGVARRPSARLFADEPDPWALLTLQHDDGRASAFFIECAVTDADYSRLGRDVMERTVMVYDPRGGNLLVDVLEADL